MCGEKYYVTVGKADHEGSPPRMRGKVRAAPLGAGDAGITPACAGKRGEGQGGPAGLWDHPRVCGEKKSAHAVRFHSVGSPPRVRGKAVIMGNLVQGKGITPACAGKSIMAHSTRTCTWDHPRVCGEKGHTQLFANIRIGSPPRVRGKVGSSSMCTRSPGITPACAGKREKRVEKIPQIWDHPRVCGEKMIGDECLPVNKGSPPRVRGKE